MSRILIITGASRGIGLATAALFLRNGYRVINLSRQRPELAGLEHLQIDLTDPSWPEQAQRALAPNVQASERIVLVHNAGAIAKDSIDAFDPTRMREVMEVNVFAPAQLTQLLLPSMPAGSSIIYVGSTLSEQAVANSCSYVTAKHALVGLMRATCQDLVGRGIHTACVCPGFTDTDMLRAHVGQSEEVLAALAGNVTQKRLIRPEEIAETLWFCSQQPVINGAVIHASLGQIQS